MNGRPCCRRQSFSEREFTPETEVSLLRDNPLSPLPPLLGVSQAVSRKGDVALSNPNMGRPPTHLNTEGGRGEDHQFSVTGVGALTSKGSAPTTGTTTVGSREPTTRKNPKRI